MRRDPGAHVVLLTLALAAAACAGNSTTSPSSTTTTASPTMTETFAGTLPVGGSSFYSFVVSQNGSVNVTLVSVSVGEVASTVTLGVAIGGPSGTGCVGGGVTSTAAGTDPQVTGVYSPGRYCVNVSDVGSLAAPAARPRRRRLLLPDRPRPSRAASPFKDRAFTPLRLRQRGLSAFRSRASRRTPSAPRQPRSFE